MNRFSFLFLVSQFVTLHVCSAQSGVQSGLSLGAFSKPLAVRKTTSKTIRKEVPGSVVNASLLDQNGDRWIASFEGLYRIRKVHMANTCLAGSCRHSIENRGGYFQHIEETSGRLQHMEPFPGELFYHPYGLAEDEKGRIWVGSMQHGLSWYDGKSFHHLPNQEILKSAFVRTLFFRKGIGLWIGTEKGLFFISAMELQKAKPGFQQVSAGEKMGALLSIQPHPEGGVWLGTDSGLLHWVNGKIQKQWFPGLRITSLLSEGSGKCWVGTEKGLFTQEGAEFRSVLSQGLDRSLVCAISRDSNGNLWVASRPENQKVYQLSVFQNAAWRKVEVTKTNEEVMPQFLQPDANNRIWMGTSQGLFLIQHRNKAGKLQPEIFRSSFSLDPKDDDC